jgi:hypothetical protein
MVSPVELRRIAAFSKLPDDQINWFQFSAHKSIRGPFLPDSRSP